VSVYSESASNSLLFSHFGFRNQRDIDRLQCFQSLLIGCSRNTKITVCKSIAKQDGNIQNDREFQALQKYAFTSMNTLISNRNSFRERQKKLQKNAVFLVFVNTDCVRGRRIFLRKQMQNKK